MLDTASQARSGAAGAGLRLVSGLPPVTAFARAVTHLMTRAAFADAAFGHVARSLAGQVNRGHYAFVQRGEAVVGFVGWALTTEPLAEAWLDGTRPLAGDDAGRGDCVLLNFWQADAPDVSRFIVEAMSAALPGMRRVYAKRHYPDGRTRPLRLDLRH